MFAKPTATRIAISAAQKSSTIPRRNFSSLIATRNVGGSVAAAVSSCSISHQTRSFHSAFRGRNTIIPAAIMSNSRRPHPQANLIHHQLDRFFSTNVDQDKGGRILLLGSGFVTTTVIEYLTRRPQNKLTIATLETKQAQEKVNTYANNPQNVTVQHLNISQDSQKLQQLISQNDVVISLIPYTFHVKVAKMVLEQNKKGQKVNMVTSSYISKEMAQLNEEAKSLGVTIMNGIGCDPGIDHLYAIRIIEEAHKKGNKVKHFESWCGGLPAPEDIGENNPLKYKFSWSPKGVLMAGTNEARYLENGQTVSVPPQELLGSGLRDLPDLHPDFDFEGYPNRDSTEFIEEYRIPEVQFLLRGTLRYKGFAKFMKALKASGLVNFDASTAVKGGSSWASVSAKILNAASTSEKDLGEALVRTVPGLAEASKEDKKLILDGFKWLGLFSETETIAQDANTVGDALSTLLDEKLSYKPSERDMVFMQNKFIIGKKEGGEEKITATMVLYEDDKFSAMAKGTGRPCAVASQLVMDGVINETGVIAPYRGEINDPIISQLEKEGISMEIVREEV